MPGKRVDTYYENALQVFFDEAETVEYIEVSRSSEIEAQLLGFEVFGVPAEALINLLETHTQMHSFDGGYTYCSEELSFGLWRPVLPEPGDDEGIFFATAGVGINGYFG